jgi:hypothetical protein
MAAATRPGGRLAMAVWASRDECDLFAVPMNAVLAELGRRGVAVRVPPVDDGPFSLHDPDSTRELLTGAGWSGVACTPHELLLALGGGLDPRAAATAALDSGPTRLVVDQLDDGGRAAACEAMAAALARHVHDDGQVHLTARILVVTAEKAG